MMIECDKNNPPLGGVLTAEVYKSQSNNVNVKWGTKSVATLTGASAPITYRTSNDLIRLLDRTFSKKKLSGLDKVTFDHWLTFSLTLEAELPASVEYLDKTLAPLTYLVGENLSGADLAVFSVLHVSSKFAEISKANPYKNVQRWMRLISAQPAVALALRGVPDDVIKNMRVAESKNKNTSRKPGGGDAPAGRQQEGKFVELPGAEMGKVLVRFPPEASGYLHIGHAKAALLNQYYQEAFQGKLIMRFDDTNPAKENVHFEKVILEDVELLQLKPDLFTHTSQYFELMLSMCERLLRERKAFVDDTPAEQMKAEREQRIESKNRGNSVEKNLQLWEEMKAGSEVGVRCCVRAKMFMDSANGCMRDPTIYRCKPEPHPRTGTQYKVYPTYDFACPIVDSIEGVTHVLRTMEYHDRDDQFFWFIEALGLRRPHIWEYSRLSMTNTVLSKRKLTWFVEQGLVDGWDDPRMPTVRGVLRRGMTVEGLRQFITAQGSSRSVVFMEWDKIWAINKKVIDPIAPRYTALESDPVAVRLQGASESSLTVPLHPKNPDVGTKTVWVALRLLIDQADAKALKEGENATFINYGNVMIDKIHRTADGTVTAIDGTPNLENKDYKKTLKLTWLADSDKSPPTEAYCVYFDHIISKPLLGKDEDFKQYIGHQTRWEVAMLGEPALANVKKGDIVQLQRRGFFRVDVAPAPRSPLSGRVQPAVLFHVPDGSAKEAPGQSKPAAAAVPTTAAGAAIKPVAAVAATEAAAAAHERVALQGELVRTLKTEKAEKGKIDEAVKQLLALKAKYKETTGQEWKPGAHSSPSAASPTLAATTSSAAAVESRAGALLREIAAQGDNVRALKSKKAEKSAVEAEVKRLLALKAEYKSATGSDWTPDAKPPPAAQAQQVPPAAPTASRAADELALRVAEQGESVRALKEKKADKASVQAEVKQLLALKAEYKALTGAEWTPSAVAAAASPAPAPPAAAPAPAPPAAAAPSPLSARIAEQGGKVRTLKEQKADKTAVQAEVQILLALKAEFKKATGKDWTPSMEATPATTPPPAAVATPVSSGGSGDELAARVTEQGNLVRDLKSKKADKASVDEAVKKLLELKAQYQAATGAAYVAPSGGAGGAGAAPAKTRDAKPKESKPKEAKPKEKKENKPKEPVKPPKAEASSGPKKVSRLGLEASKDVDLSEWYSQVITKAEMIEYYDISGCYILRPWSFAIWEAIRDFLSTEFKKLGVKDCYFPIFVSKAVLEREKTHIADFAPEVAWVTHSGSSELAEHIAVRPTSETVMYPAYAKWIQSHRDLPLRLNQWNNVVRWEFKQPQPFIRTREFLWQEGHTAFLTKEEADAEVLVILELYARVYEDLLAIPVVRGRKSEKEKFAGGDYTTTVEGYVPASGRGIQGATSHHLGQNFSRMFDIVYDDPDTQEKKHVYQNSWGITTRTIGVMVLVHGDDRGLVLPPRVASVQVVVVPCGVKADSTPEERVALADSCRAFERALVAAGVRAEGDYRDNYSPGWKYNHWELKGVPIRVELGPKEMSRGEVVAVRRLDGSSSTFKRDTAPEDIKRLLERTHEEMLSKATAERDSRTTLTTQWAEFTAGLDKKHVLLAPFCGDIPCEDNIKNDSARQDEEAASGAPAMGAKSLCIPFQQPRALTAVDKCIHPACTHAPKFFGLFGRSY